MIFPLEDRKRILTAKWEVSIHDKDSGKIIAKQPIQVYQSHDDSIRANPCKFDFTKKKLVEVHGIFVWCNGKKLKCIDDKDRTTIYGNFDIVWKDIFVIPHEPEDECNSIDMSFL